MNYLGTIIEESLSNPGVLIGMRILSTKVEAVGPGHQTPWLKQWTLHRVEIPEAKAKEVAQQLSLSLDYSHKNAWYADFKNDHNHFIVYKDKIFVVRKGDRAGYAAAKNYGLALGIPVHQVDFPENL